jgi:hypothetical protein
MNKPAGSPLPAEVYDIQIRSLRAAVEHLGLTDLIELDGCAQRHGSPEDRALISAVMTMLDGLKRGGFCS